MSWILSSVLRSCVKPGNISGVYEKESTFVRSTMDSHKQPRSSHFTKFFSSRKKPSRIGSIMAASSVPDIPSEPVIPETSVCERSQSVGDLLCDERKAIESLVMLCERRQQNGVMNNQVSVGGVRVTYRNVHEIENIANKSRLRKNSTYVCNNLKNSFVEMQANKDSTYIVKSPYKNLDGLMSPEHSSITNRTNALKRYSKSVCVLPNATSTPKSVSNVRVKSMFNPDLKIEEQISIKCMDLKTTVLERNLKNSNLNSSNANKASGQDDMCKVNNHHSTMKRLRKLTDKVRNVKDLENNITLCYDGMTKLADSRLTVRASTHQGYLEKIGILPEYSNTQCTATSLIAILYSTLHPAKSWKRKHMDAILIHGNSFHTYLRDVAKVSQTPDNRVSLYELPKKHEVQLNGKIVYYKKSKDTLYGMLGASSDQAKEWDLLPLDEALHKFLDCSTVSGCLLTVDCFSFAVMKDPKGFYRYFDSHSRNKQGHVEINGKAVLLTFRNINRLLAYINSQHRMGTQFEVIGISTVKEFKTVALSRGKSYYV